MDTSTQNGAPRRKRLWLRILFGLSLALNLLVIGLALGAVIRFGGEDGVRPPPSSFGATMYRQLPREDRAALRNAMKGSPADHIARRKSEAAAIGSALRADPFDARVLTDLLEAQITQRQAWQMSVQSAWLARVEKMSTAERAAYADRVQDALSRRHMSRKNKDKHQN